MKIERKFMNQFGFNVDKLESQSAKVVFAVYQSMVWGMGADATSFQIQSIFCDDSDHHANRSAYMKYANIHIANVGEVFWLLAFGHVAGKAYLFDGMEVDIACRLLDHFPTCGADLTKQLSYDFKKRPPGLNRFSSSFLGSRNGKLVQVIRGDDSWMFNLIPWARKKFNKGQPIIVEPMKSFREAGNPFSEFLPTGHAIKMDQRFVRELAEQIIFHLQSFGTGSCACPSFDI